jgi:hypothetical protein
MASHRKRTTSKGNKWETLETSRKLKQSKEDLNNSLGHLINGARGGAVG